MLYNNHLILFHTKKQQNGDFMEDTTFEVLYKDTVTAKVEIRGNKTHIKRFDKCPIHCLFPTEEMDTYGALEILEGRCFPRNRDNLEELLHKLGLKTYHPLDIIRKTHGLMRNDFVWIRFQGENLKYDDIKIRN